MKIKITKTLNGYNPSIYYLYKCIKKLHIKKIIKKKITINLIIVKNKTMLQITKKFYNNNYRHPTNILNFNTDNTKEIICCAKLLKKESKYMNKNFFKYWKHLLIHSFLHLNNYTHFKKNDTYLMELLEEN